MNQFTIVTGGAGFIGSNLTDELIRRGGKVVVVDNLSTGVRAQVNKAAHFVRCDIRHFQRLVEVFKGASLVYHLAALPRVQRSIADPLETNAVNIDGTLSVLEAARVTGIKRVIYASSSSIYGESGNKPFKENHKPNPLSPYALQKYAGELYCEAYSHLYGLSTICARLFSVYGHRQNDQEQYATLIGSFLKQKRDGKPLIIYGTGEQIRDFTHVNDVVEALCQLGEKEQDVPTRRGTVTYNVCSSQPHSVNEIAKMVGGKIVHLPGRSGEARRICGDYSKISRSLGWFPKQSIENYIEKCK